MKPASHRIEAPEKKEIPYIAASLLLTVVGLAIHTFGLPGPLQAQIEWLLPADQYGDRPAWVCYLVGAVFLFAGFGRNAAAPADPAARAA